MAAGILLDCNVDSAGIACFQANEKKVDPKMTKVVDGAVASNETQKELDETRLHLEKTREGKKQKMSDMYLSQSALE